MMHRRINLETFVILTLFLIPGIGHGQTARESADDSFREMETDTLTLRFFNALDGNPIRDALVTMKGIGSYTSDHEGKTTFPIPEDGYYEVDFSKDGFITSTFKIEIMAGTLFFNRFSVSPRIPIGTLRVVLDWGENPGDLDAHLQKKDGYHISYRRMKVSRDGIAQLDRDDTTGFGPETITAKRIDESAIYSYFVHDYTNRKDESSNDLSHSKATIKVYGGDNRLLNVFQVPRSRSGTYWHVFRIEKGDIVPAEQIGGDQPGF
jgi:hypothetical protein